MTTPKAKREVPQLLKLTLVEGTLQVIFITFFEAMELISIPEKLFRNPLLHNPDSWDPTPAKKHCGKV